MSWQARVGVVVAAVIVMGSGARADEGRVGHGANVWASKRFAKHTRAAFAFGDQYREFLSNKTEREVTRAALAMARKQGFRDLFAGPVKIKPGARLLASVHEKLSAFIVVGSEPLGKGVHVVGAHIDSVRIDLKQRPLYADGNLALLQTHYYGGLKEYQWLSTPLELRGVVIKRDGARVDISIGARPTDPVLVIPDIAPHISGQVDDEEGEDVHPETLDPILSSTPLSSAVGDPFAERAAALLASEYGISEEDLVSAELQLVPAGQARDVGIDRALVGGYGQDDRASAYAALRALLDVAASGRAPRHTAIVILLDKEEIGSTGNTGARSSFFRRVIAELFEGAGTVSTEVVLDRALAASLFFSADVTGGVHPQYPQLYDRRNSVFIGAGVAWDQSGVHAEVMGYVRTLLERAEIVHQPAVWGKSLGSKDEEGTVLPFFTQHGMNGIAVQIPLLSMHSLFELVSKADLFEGYRAYRAFLAD